MKMRLTKILTLFFVGFLLSASVQANELTAKEKEAAMEAYSQFFKLFNKCEKIGLSVNIPINSPKPKIYLTEKAITNAVESRLRSARIFTTDSPKDFLLVEVLVWEDVFNIGLSFGKVLEDSRLSEHFSFHSTYVVGTWHRAFIGRHSGEENFILSSLSQKVDEFLVEYLKVNQEKNCRKKGSLRDLLPGLKEKPQTP